MMLDEGRIRDHVSSIFFDFTKTFDNECHVRLINKLKKLGFVSSTLH